MKYGETFDMLYAKIKNRLFSEGNMPPSSPASYPYYWNGTITLYNKITVQNKTEWVRHVIKNVFYSAKHTEQLNQNTMFHATSYIVRIPQSGFYVPKSKYTDFENTFTLNVGDIIFFGEITEEIDEFISGKRSNDILAKHTGECFVIKFFAEDTQIKGLEHYRIEGA